MVASYPGTVRTFTSKTDIVDTVYADHPNSLQDEVVAVETTLGLNPHVSTSPSASGSFNAVSTVFSSLAARLANIEIGVVSDAHTQYLRRVGGDVVTPGTASTIGLRIRCATSQTADLLQFLDSSGATKAAFSANGSLTVNNLTVTGTQTNVAGSATALDLGATTGIAAGTGANFGDKIQLYTTTFGFGMQSNRLVAYVAANAAFAVRQNSASGYASSGTDAVTLSSAGVGTFTGDVVVGSTSLPRGRLASATITSFQSGVTSTVDLTGSSVTFSAATGRRYRVTASGYGCSSPDGATIYVMTLVVGGATVATARGAIDGSGTTANSWALYSEHTGLSGTVTAKVQVAKAVGSGTVSHNAGSTIPARILVEDIGA